MVDAAGANVPSSAAVTGVGPLSARACVDQAVRDLLEMRAKVPSRQLSVTGQVSCDRALRLAVGEARLPKMFEAAIAAVTVPAGFDCRHRRSPPQGANHTAS